MKAGVGWGMGQVRRGLGVGVGGGRRTVRRAGLVQGRRGRSQVWGFGRGGGAAAERGMGPWVRLAGGEAGRELELEGWSVRWAGRVEDGERAGRSEEGWSGVERRGGGQ